MPLVCHSGGKKKKKGAKPQFVILFRTCCDFGGLPA